MTFASRGSKCVKCGCPIHHKIQSTGRTFPANIELSDGYYYSHLGGELCRKCDKKTPIEEKDPVMANVYKRLMKMKIEEDKL